jgi:hypothetical protein
MGIIAVNLSHEVDAVVMSAVHSAGEQECVAGVKGAHAALRPGGSLIIKAPLDSIGGKAGMDVVGPAAEQLFKEPVASGECGLFGQYDDPDKPSTQQAVFVIYQKQ